MSLEPSLIEHCAPTLASLKIGSLFSFISPCWQSLFIEAAKLNALMQEKGLSLRIVRADDDRALCYLYREDGLVNMLSDRDAAAFLRDQGYESLYLPDALDTLCERMACSSSFPHEVGVFLGYPLSDVLAFIEHKGRDCSCCGCWKAYGDACAARRLFEKYDKCTRVYRRLYRAGRTLSQLTVGGQSPSFLKGLCPPFCEPI